MKSFPKLSFLWISLLILSVASTGRSQYEIVDSNVPIIERLTLPYKGRLVSLAELDKIVREIAQDGLFQVVYVEKLSGNKVALRAQQSAKIKAIEVTGNASYSKEEILEAMGIRTGQVLSDLEISQSIEKVKDLYQSSGFFNFQINYRKTLGQDGLTLTLDIAEAEYCVISDIQIFSKNDYLNQQIEQMIPTFINVSYNKETPTLIEKRINTLLLEHRFLTAKVQNTGTVFNQDKTKVKLKFNITNAVQYEFVFHGNEFFSHFDFTTNSEIGRKFLYLSDSSSEIVEDVRDLYLKSGFPKVEIKSSEKYFPSSKKKVYIFEIDEGPRVRIGRVEVVGKISRDQSFYESLFQDYLALQAHSVYYVREDIERAAEEVVTHLKRHGHLQADLLSINHEFTEQNKALITIQIDEGILTYVRQVLFRGSKSFSNIELKEKVKIEANKPLNIEEVERSFDLLESFYKEKGYLEFKVKNRNASVIQYKPGQPYADLVYELYEGPKILVKNIEVNGNKKTKDYVIRRELNFKEGELLTLSKVTTTIDRLEKTGLFGKVNVRSLEQGTMNGDRTIVIEVEERKPGLFSSGVGLLNEGRITSRGYVGALYNNLWGKARGISSRVDIKYQDEVYYVENRVALAYYEPFIMEDRLRGRVSLVREQRLLDFNSGNPTILSTNEIRFSTEKEFSKHFRFTYNVWGFSNQETFLVRDDQPEDESVKIQNVATTGPVFEFDYRNDPFIPSEGTFSRFELEYSDPLIGSSRDNPDVTGTELVAPGAKYPRRKDEKNEINYYRASFLTTRYTPLTKSKRWVWANSLRGGYLKNVSSRSDSGVPQVRSFFLGGSSTIRGFSIGTTETVPGKRELCLKQGLITDAQETSRCRFDEIFVRKDSAFVLFKSELRFPISGAFGGVVFYDGGAVVLGEFDLEDPYRDSIGFGFSYDTPVGSFIVELGYKLDRKLGGPNSVYDKEADVAFHLAIGTF